MDEASGFPAPRRRYWLWAICGACAVLLALGVWLVVWALTAEPGRPTDFGARANALSLSRQAGGGVNGWDALDRATQLSARASEQRAGEKSAPPKDWPKGAVWPIDFSAAVLEGVPGVVLERADAAIAELESAGVFALLDEAGSARRFIREYPSNIRAMDILLPELGSGRELARASAYQMLVASRAGDWRARDRALERGLAMARAFASQPVLISRLSGQAVRAAVLDELRVELRERPHDELELRELFEILARQEFGAGMDLALEGERLFVLDVVDRTHTDDGRGSGRFLPAEAAGFAGEGGGGRRIANVMSPLFPAKRETIEKFNTHQRWLREWIALSPRVRVGVERPSERFQRTLGATDRLLRTVLPSLEHAIQASEAEQATYEATRVAIALEVHRARAGAYPDTLEALVPGCIGAIPTDPASGMGFVYRREGHAYVLYSVGRDCKDDGGASGERGGKDAREPDAVFTRERGKFGR